MSLRSKWLSRIFSNTTVQKHQFFIKAFKLLYVQLSHPYMTIGKTIALTRQTFVAKVMSLLFKMLSRLVMALLPWSKCLLISWLQSPSAVILEPKKIKSLTFSIDLPWSDGTRCPDLSFLNVEFFSYCSLVVIYLRLSLCYKTFHIDVQWMLVVLLVVFHQSKAMFMEYLNLLIFNFFFKINMLKKI